MKVDDSSANEGSIVGLPVDSKSGSSNSSNSSLDHNNDKNDEEDSTDELTAAGDALCRSLLMKAQQQGGDQESPQKEGKDTNDANDASNRPTSLAAIDTCRSITPRSTPPPLIDEQPASEQNTNGQQSLLEERVLELETKLATLSRILQQQQRLSISSLLSSSPSNSQRQLLQTPTQQQQRQQNYRLPQIPLMEGVPFQRDDHDEHFSNTSMPHTPDESPPSQRISRQQQERVPYLESPAPMEMDMSPTRRNRSTMHQRKRLSFHLLYDGNEDNLARADDENHRIEQKLQGSIGDDSHAPVDNDDDNDDGNENNNLNEKEAIENGKDSESSNYNIETEPHPLHKDSNKNGTTNSQENQSATSASNQEGKHNGTSSKSSDISKVAARVVKGDTETSTRTRTSRSESMDTSAASTTSNTSRGGRTSRSNSITSDCSASPGVHAGGNRIRAAILPPLRISKDKRSKWLDHLNSFQESNHDVDLQMQEFIKVPGAVEKNLTSGFLICVDSFLYVCTILPIRFAWSCVLLSLHYFFKWTKKPAGKFQFHRRHTYQLIQVSIILVVYRYVLLPVSIGKLYHWIRGQAMLKLYVLIAMAEIFDRLMCSLGQDCLDSLYWNTTRRPRTSRMLMSVSVALVYTALHSLILFIHVATLNVAMNSADEALLALLIGGNFAEIKSTVFKKYNKPSLFKIFTSDICERFKLALFLGLVLLLNFCQGMDSRKMSDYQRIAGIVWMSELLCDWLKHAFITKFNFIPSSVYQEYGLLLAGDVTGIGHEGVNLDHSHAVVKRLGFAQMPLVCVMARLVREAVKYMFLRIDGNTIPFWLVVITSTGCWLFLLVLKMFLGAYLQRISLEKLHAAPELSQTPLKGKQKQQ